MVRNSSLSYFADIVRMTSADSLNFHHLQRYISILGLTTLVATAATLLASLPPYAVCGIALTPLFT